MTVKRELIGMEIWRSDLVKEKYKKGKFLFTMIDIYRDKKYGAIAKVKGIQSPAQEIFNRIPKKTRKKMSKALEKAIDNNKPIDTSKWKKVTEKDIREQFAYCTLMKEIMIDSMEAREFDGRARAFYWILHDKRPPKWKRVNWTNYALDFLPFEKIITELKGTKRKDIHNFFDLRKPKKNRQQAFQRLKRSLERNMIKVI